MNNPTRKPIDTLKHTCGDAAETLDDVTGFDYQTTVGALKKNTVSVLVSCETNDIRYGFNTNPTQDSGTAIGHVLDAGDAIELVGHGFVTGFRFINKVNGSNAVLQITTEINI